MLRTCQYSEAAFTPTAALPAPVRDAVNAAFIDALHLALRCGSAALAAAALLVALLLRPQRGVAPSPADGRPAPQPEAAQR
ncbi:hypothetical protein [Streptomyces sp. NPDC097981]|uniref:hypothetical protein n=1 Tax=Streptomyces sp. NPDC097981 TaxID=3155428 RepID=UPI00331768D0